FRRKGERVLQPRIDVGCGRGKPLPYGTRPEPKLNGRDPGCAVQLPEAGPPQEDPLGLEGGDDPALKAGAETGPGGGAAEGAPRGTKGDFDEPRPAPILREILRAPLRVPVELLDVLRDRPDRVVNERRVQRRSRPSRAHVGVDALLGIAGGPAPHEPHEPVLS